MSSISNLEKIYKYPILLFYFYHFKKGHRTLKEWRKELSTYDDAEPNHPLRVFVEMVDKYGT